MGGLRGNVTCAKRVEVVFTAHRAGESSPKSRFNRSDGCGTIGAGQCIRATN
jgi:hypothetical protein